MFVKVFALVCLTSIARGGGDSEFQKESRFGKHLTKVDRFCQRLNGPASYCKYWQVRPVCQFGNQPCRSDEVSHHDHGSRVEESWRGDEVSHRPKHHLTRVDRFCQRLNGPASYCKYWQVRPVCQFGNQPCRPEECHKDHSDYLRGREHGEGDFEEKKDFIEGLDHKKEDFEGGRGN